MIDQTTDISPPIGGTKRGRPRTSIYAAICQSMAVSRRSLERAIAIRRNGVPELMALVECGHLRLSPALYLSRFSHDLQRAICNGGAQNVRNFAVVASAIQKLAHDGLEAPGFVSALGDSPEIPELVRRVLADSALPPPNAKPSATETAPPMSA